MPRPCRAIVSLGVALVLVAMVLGGPEKARAAEQPGTTSNAVDAEAKSAQLKHLHTKSPAAEQPAAPVGGQGYRTALGPADSPIPVVVVRGTPYEMGYHVGRLMREEIGRFVPAAVAAFQQELGLSEAKLQAAWSHLAAYSDDRLEQELVGLAEGSGVPLGTLQTFHTMPLLMPYSCSSIAAWGKATADGHLYQTRNLDWSMEVGAHEFPLVVVYLPEHGVAHVVPTFAGMIGAHTGMNACGLALSEMGDSPAKEAPYNLNAPHFTFFFRTLLYDADSLTRALEIFQGLPQTKRYHFVFGDGRADQRAVKIRAHSPEPPENRIVIWKDNDPGDEFAPRVLENVVYNDEGRGAYPLLKESWGKLDSEKMIAIANHIPIRGSNVVDVVYDATAMRLWISFAKGKQEAYRRPYTLIDLTTLDADQDGQPDYAAAFGGP